MKCHLSFTMPNPRNDTFSSFFLYQMSDKEKRIISCEKMQKKNIFFVVYMDFNKIIKKKFKGIQCIQKHDLFIHGYSKSACFFLKKQKLKYLHMCVLNFFHFAILSNSSLDSNVIYCLIDWQNTFLHLSTT